MRMFLALIAAWIVASLAFALGWVRISDWDSSSYVVRHVLVEYGIVIGFIVFAAGLPLAWAASRMQLVRWWSATGLAAAVGALLGGVSTASGRDNPFGLSFSPWNRNRPGFISEFEAPWSAADNWGSVVFGAIIGALIGATFWFFYVRVLRPNKSLERTRDR
jgi:hypothetical protein